jgi:hypothetical protein
MLNNIAQYTKTIATKLGLPLWTNYHEILDNDIDEIESGSLVYYENEKKWGVGVVKTFGYGSYADELNGRLSAYVVSIDPNFAFGDYVYPEQLETITANEYIEEMYYYGNKKMLQRLFQHIADECAIYKNLEAATLRLSVLQ